MNQDDHAPEFFDRVQSRDRVATETFFDHYGEIALKLLRGRFRNIGPADREELAQDVLVEAIEKLDAYDRSRSFKPWFTTMVRRRAIDFTRRREREQVESAHGPVPREVSLDFATSVKAPETIRQQVLKAATEYLDAESGPEDVDHAASPDAEAPRTGPGGLAGRLLALNRWIAARTPEEQLVLSHYMFDTPWKDVAAEIESIGGSVSPGAAKVQGHRLIKKAAAEIEIIWDNDDH